MKRLVLIVEALAWYAMRARCEFLDKHGYVETWRWTGRWRASQGRFAEERHFFEVCRTCRCIKLGSDRWGL